jgi:hypothetical protein
MMKTHYLIMLSLLVLPEFLSAQQTDTVLVNSSSVGTTSFLEVYKANREMSYTSPKGELGSPVKFVLIGKLTTSYFLVAPKVSRFAFALIPEFTVKVIDERSAGVRTPSLKLGGMFYYQIDSDINEYKYASIRFTHHSNGQDGNALNEDGSINTANGNFSTNSLTASYHFGKARPLNNRTTYQLNQEVGLEWHRWFNFEKALENDYGFTRFNYVLSLRRFRSQHENWRLNATCSYALNKMEVYKLLALRKRLNAETSFHYSFPFMHKAFLMGAVGYYGEDPYNIYYRNKYSYLRFGVSSSL